MIRMFSALMVGLTAIFSLFWGLEAHGADDPLTRPYAPVVITGAQLPQFTGVPIDELRLYQFVNNAWEPLPFQVDEVTASGSYTTTEDGLLDANDELVLMGNDAQGISVSTNEWVTDAQAESQPRYALSIQDPLFPTQQGVVYLYRSTTLPFSSINYLTWDEVEQTVTAVSYTLSFNPEQFLGVANLTINNNPNDILDRQKTRILLSSVLGDTLINEEDLVDDPLIGQGPLPIRFSNFGAVRALGGSASNQLAFYRSHSNIAFNQEIPSVPFATVDEIRISLDFNNPSQTGFAPATYHNSQNQTATIDGQPDTVSAELASWYQVDGATGSLVSLSDVSVSVASGTPSISTYYQDNTNAGADDTGDGQAFGDAGIFVSGDDITQLQLNQQLYVLPAGAGSMGETLSNWAETPLTVTPTLETPAGGHVLTVEKTAVNTIHPSQLLTYTLTVRHSHPFDPVTQLVLTDVLPAQTSFVTATLPFSLTDGVVQWTQPQLDKNDIWQVQLVVSVAETATQTIENQTYAVSSSEVPLAIGIPVVTTITPDEMQLYLPIIMQPE